MALARRDAVPAAVRRVAQVRPASADAVQVVPGRSHRPRAPLPHVARGVVKAVAVGGKASTGQVPRHPSAPVSSVGKVPCQTFIRCSPAGSRSSPQGNGEPTSPPRAACSHSASVGSRPPHHAAYASASRRDTCTTGWSPRSDTDECGPFWVRPVSAVHLPPPRRGRHPAGRGEVVGEEAGEHERPAESFRVGHVPGRRDEHIERGVADRAPAHAVRRDLGLAHRPLLGVVRVVAADESAPAGERDQAVVRMPVTTRRRAFQGRGIPGAPGRGAAARH